MGKIICITGASTGIGLATALRFAREGWTVYAGTRNPARDQELYRKENNLHFVQLEVTDPASIQSVIDLISDEQGSLDVLFANAGFGYLRALGQAPVEDIHRVFDTNVYGVMHTIRAALPLLQRSGYAHIVATSSVGGLVGQPMNEIYCASKFAVEGLLESLATYYKPQFNIDVTLLEPGAIATEFTKTVMGHVAGTGGILEDEYKPVIDAYTAAFLQRNVKPQTPESVAEVMWELVHMETKPVRIRTSERAEAFVAHKVSADPTGLDGVLSTRKIQLNM
ncbi:MULTISPECIES: SDR family oxidoreductase [unclassified Paenibacillus]|uniref:SDR family oxidoreductase n=1 Tax=unclassified Paenibacillus TaxID=185978 RepID=UPI00240715AD|nr:MULTISPECIES: SDR family oxidoreductase [unclassified Paenibacillus]MDF9840853.1 NAD(P)-dependent dehydrogenase (short-subunit alcohol dehydrogenase family) [Paenibacillus sp. PastF-2]MDF9847437.1 NAD(P)-dependent dehydrogenase (short-subunit alcohol dehydrogenase family) [Paenibacillus sp. PastM-2]MDF9853986.1 NAD(P)-dependent dehydrogenase (short-subunit alcohol dehydrogenase family) [Paenibacillus sp. PastF-1]MDH6479258.1 NAD(P)-dependent dehydrogenase (short-subunit alcohol dehydrogenase